jgi:hypothetical protein
MKLFSIAIISLILLSSCSLEKRLAKYCPLCPIETTTVIERVDSTITVEVPGDTVTVTDSLYCDSLGNVRMIRIHELENENMSIRTRIINNVLTTDCISDTVYIDKIVKGLNTTTTIEKKINVPYKPWWMIALSWIGGIFLLIIAILAGLKYLKR